MIIDRLCLGGQELRSHGPPAARRARRRRSACWLGVVSLFVALGWVLW